VDILFLSKNIRYCWLVAPSGEGPHEGTRRHKCIPSFISHQHLSCFLQDSWRWKI